MEFRPENLRSLRPLAGDGSKLYIETYGCQMNAGDSEIVLSILQDEGYRYTERVEEADAILLNTCSIRDNAEQRIRSRLRELGPFKRKKPGVRIGILGCMAERLKERLLEGDSPVDVVAGPDAYRDLPRLLRQARDGAPVGQRAAVAGGDLCRDLARAALTATASALSCRSCAAVTTCARYCVVPYTRGSRAFARPAVDHARGRRTVRRGLPRGDAARPKRQLVPLGARREDDRLRGPARASGFRRSAAAGALLDLPPQGPERRTAPRDGQTSEHLPRHSPARPVGQLPDTGTDEPQVHARMVSRPNRGDPPHPARLRDLDRPDRGILHRDRAGTPRHAVADAGGGLRVRLHVQILGAAEYESREAHGRRRARKREDGAG